MRYNIDIHLILLLLVKLKHHAVMANLLVNVIDLKMTWYKAKKKGEKKKEDQIKRKKKERQIMKLKS